MIKLINDDCLKALQELPENSIDTCITDPPYGLGFMGKEWDTFDKSQFGIAGNEGDNDLKVKKNFKILPRYNNEGLYDFTFEWAQAVYRVLKPGGLLLSFGGTRTYHRIVCAIEDAGFEIRDCVMWVYGSGFPKSYNVAKGIEAQIKTGKSSPTAQRITAMGEDYQMTPLAGTPGYGYTGNFSNKDTGSKPMEITTPEAQLWGGWGTQLKPAYEPIVIAQKPLDGTYAENALKWGVAGYWIDGGRIETDWNDRPESWKQSGFNKNQNKSMFGIGGTGININKGRFPSNVIHDGSDEVMRLFPSSVSRQIMVSDNRTNIGNSMFLDGVHTPENSYTDYGSVARFFYCAKASRSERNAGLEGMEEHLFGQSGGAQQALKNGESEYLQDSIGLNKIKKMQNHHPTVKPLELMRYLVRLTKTPTGGVVLDPFMGSGTTGCACVLEGRDFIGIEKEAEYVEIAEKRIAYWSKQPKLPVE